MEQLIVLGTGNAMATKCYNTCFALQDGEKYFLIDAGGGNGILQRLEAANIPYQHIHHIFVTHEHCDHILGMVWMIRKIATLMKNGKYDGDLHIYCHQGLIPTMTTFAELTLQKKFTALIGDRILFHAIGDGSQEHILNYDVTFFTIHSTKAEQYGFTLTLNNGKKLTCLGDEPYNPLCESYVKGSQWVLCEAFCLYGERDKFKPYEKHHSTVKEACELAQQMEVPNLVLWHTEDKNYERRKELYTAEGKEFYHGNLFVPNDLETIAL